MRQFESQLAVAKTHAKMPPKVAMNICLEEIKRVLKPEGKLIMFEHVLSKNLFYALALKTMSIFTEKLEGTYLDRHTVNNAKKAGFEILSHKNVYLDIVKALVAKPI